MESLIFGSVIILAVAAVAWRRLSARRRTRRVDALPGRSRNNAIAARNFREMDEFVRAMPCTCGGSGVSVGERTEYLEGRELRVVRLECLRCEDRYEVYFDLGGLAH